MLRRIYFWMPMKSLIARLLLVFAVLANVTLPQAAQAFVHPQAHHVEAATEHDCCDQAGAHAHDHQALPGALDADCRCDMSTCAPGVVLNLTAAAPQAIPLTGDLAVWPDEAPPSSGSIPPLRPPRA